jgi:hypothetical protein
MNKKFIKYSLIAVVLTYSTVLINMNYGPVYSNKNKASAVSLYKDKNPAEVVAEGGFFTPCINSTGNKLLYSSGDDIYELDLERKDIKQLTTMGNCYNPVYNEKDNNIIAFARNDGIYKMNLTTMQINKVMGSDNPQVSYAKPNFTSEEDLIYFKVTVIPNEEGHSFIEKEPAIYKLSRDGKVEEKIIDGYNPVLSKDGKKLLYEMKENIYVLDLGTKDSILIDKGKYAAWSNSGNFISYAKFERTTVPYNKLKEKKNLFIDMEFSNIYTADLGNLKNKNKLTREQYDNSDIEIKSWANDAKYGSGEQHFLLVSKVAYFDSEWSKDDSELYVSSYNSEKGAFELLKFKLNKD